jgi:phage gpG-like protein
MVKAHTREMTLPWGDIPARSFMLIQDDDWDEIKDTLADFLLNAESRIG